MNAASRNLFAAFGLALAVPAYAEITFYQREDFAGSSFTATRAIADFATYGFNDRASSVVVIRDRWEVCADARFSGRCAVLRPGSYASLAEMGLNDRISSVRAVSGGSRSGERRDAPMAAYDSRQRIDERRDAPVAAYDSRPRIDERRYEARVISARAVAAAPEQRCWIEREQVVEEQGSANVPGAIVGAVIGGVLGHQVGGGHGKDIATVGGAVAGAALGANVGDYGGGSQVRTQDVERCAPVAARTDHWEVAYQFRGEEHRVAMSARPGRTVTVNARGDPIGATR